MQARIQNIVSKGFNGCKFFTPELFVSTNIKILFIILLLLIEMCQSLNNVWHKKQVTVLIRNLTFELYKRKQT